MSLDELGPVDLRSTSERIADRLREAIVHGTLGPGTQLGEADLAARFAVSRGPVREAMQRLVAEGLLRSIRNRGIFVMELTLDDVVDVYRSRTVIECGAVDLIVDGGLGAATADALGPVLEVMSGAAARGDAPAVSDADQVFHQVLVESAGSPRLTRAARTLLAETRMCLGALQSTYGDLGDQVLEHVALRDAVATGDRAALLALLRDHLDDAVDRLRATGVLGLDPAVAPGA